MNPNESVKSKKDAHLGLALAGFGCLLFLFAAAVLRGHEDAISEWAEINKVALLCSAAAAMANVLAAVVLIKSEKRQGRYLQGFASKAGESLAPWPYRRLLAAGVIGTLAYALDGWSGARSPVWLTDFPMEIELGSLRQVLSVSFAVGVFAATYFLLRLGEGLRPRSGRGLGPMPRRENRIVLGADETQASSPEWVSIGKKGLSGNILITGSIGSGKTQGTLLPYLDQILANFRPRPSILVIDPKRSMVAEALHLIKRHGLEDQCLHIALDGDVRYNPIYHSQALRGGRCAEIAHMLRAGAVNTLGKAEDSSFWDISAYNLMKNALVYCASAKGYYTLDDLYVAITSAEDGKLVADFEEALKTKTFTEEERYNVIGAQTYFALEFTKFETRLRTGIIASATAFLNQFREFQASQIFCPKPDAVTLYSLDTAIDQGMIIILDIKNEALAKAIGTIVKLQFEASTLARIGDKNRPQSHCSIMVIDEFQDVVTSGHGVALGDESFLAKGREANAMTIAATQSLTSLANALKREAAASELFQNFRTRIACHSVDHRTVASFQQIAGEVDCGRVSRSLSENSQNVSQCGLGGGIEARSATNVTESVSVANHREYRFKASDFAELPMFECIAQISHGANGEIRRLCLKPYFLGDKSMSQKKLMAKIVTTLIILTTLAAGSGAAVAHEPMPTLCSVVSTPDFDECSDVEVSGCTCPGFPPHPCALISYFRPETFIEVRSNAGESFFGALPLGATQLASTAAQSLVRYGAEGELDSHAFHAHVLDVPEEHLIGNFLPCGSGMERGCFAAMSEHLGDLWSTGSADLIQPSFLAWLAAPSACLAAGAAQSLGAGVADPGYSAGGTTCSARMDWARKFPPSSHAACTGWGTFFPRTGVYDGPSQMIGALMAAARIKSLASEVFQAVPRSPDDKWEMIQPQSSACFREGQNASILESAGRVTEGGRLSGGPRTGYLFAIWRRVSCCRDFPEAEALRGELAALKATCSAGRAP